MRRGTILTRLLLGVALLCAGCSAGGSSAGTTAAPPPGPVARSGMTLTVEVPESPRAVRARSLVSSVVVEVADPNVADPGTLSGRRVVANGAVVLDGQPSNSPSQSQSQRVVQVNVLEVPPGQWDIYVFGVDGDGRILANAQPFRLDVQPGQLYTRNVQLSPVGTITQLAINPPNPQIAPGTNQAFRAIATLLVGGTQDVTTQVVWSSSNPAVATIDTQGIASSVAPGNTTITAQFQGLTATTQLTVLAGVTVVSISVAPQNAVATVGATQQFTALGQLSDGSTQDLTVTVTWSSSAPGVASINGAGLATALSAGATNITATFQALNASTNFTVTPVPLVSIAVTPTPAALPIGGTVQLTATGTFADGSTQDLSGSVVWASSNASVAMVGATGLVTAVGAGPANITATLGAISGQVAVTVQQLKVVIASDLDPELSSYLVDPATGNLTLADTQDLLPTGNAPFGVAAHPNGRFVYTLLGDPDNSIHVCPIDPVTGNLGAPAFVVATGVADAEALAVGPQFLYTGHFGGGDIRAFQLNADGSLIDRGTTVSGLGNVTDLTLLQSGGTERFLYAMDEFAGPNPLVFGFAINANGSLGAQVLPAAGQDPGTGVTDLAARPNTLTIQTLCTPGGLGNFNQIVVADLASGSMGAAVLGTSPAADGQGLIFDPTGQFVYTMHSNTTNGAQSFTFDGAGNPVLISGLVNLANPLKDLAVDPQNRFLYVLQDAVAGQVNLFRLTAGALGAALPSGVTVDNGKRILVMP
ncbi:MAG: Ig-like domain-containing protein [Candidatus Eremiobacterota bacterium]